MSILKEERIGGQRLILGDCLKVMPLLGEFDAVVTDPPYGIGADKLAKRAADSRIAANGKSKAGRGWKDYGATNWDDCAPDRDFFNQILNNSRDQIIWGGNYFTQHLPATMRWLVWDKMQRNFSLADCEFAWTSQWKAARILSYSRGAALQDGKKHPTQKPVFLMEWCIRFLSEEATTILDPFMGSGTTLIACQKLGRKGTGIELDPDYFEIACKRVDEAARQNDLFVDPPQQEQPKQEGFDL